MSEEAVIKYINAPLTEETVKDLHAGDVVRISGYIYTARDAAHKRLYEALERGEQLPLDLTNNVIYYVGPTPAKPGEVVGSAGPTTSGRMDKYTPTMIEQGMRGMIGKGLRSQEVIDACAKHGAVYFVAVGGAAAVITQSIKSETMIAYEDLGPEAIRRYEVKDFPAIVCIDSEGNDFYKVGIAKYKKSNIVNRLRAGFSALNFFAINVDKDTRIIYYYSHLNNTLLSRVAEGTGPMMPGNQTNVMVLHPASVILKDERKTGSFLRRSFFLRRMFCKTCWIKKGCKKMKNY